MAAYSSYRPSGIAKGNMTTTESHDRCLLIRSRLRAGYQLSEFGVKNLQHVLTDWFPRAVYVDLTDDTHSVDIEVRKDPISGKNVLEVSFRKADGGVIKRSNYPEDRLIGRTCPFYDAKRTKYDGKEESYDRRLVYYTIEPVSRL
jgi:hypothetical protein